MEGCADVHAELRPAARSLHGLYEREPSEPPVERGVAGVTRHHRACWLFPLPLPAALRTRRRHRRCLVRENDVSTLAAASRRAARGASQLLRRRRPAEILARADTGTRYVLQAVGQS